MGAIKLFKDETVKVEDLIERGKKGITNKQMIPALKKVISSNENVNLKLNLLYKDYEDVFISASKYVPDKMKMVLEVFIKDKLQDEKFELPIGKKLRYGYEDFQIEEDKLEIASEFKSNNNKKLATFVKLNSNWESKLNEEEIRMVKLAIQDKSTTEIGLEFGYSKDKVYTIIFRNNGKSILNKLGI